MQWTCFHELKRDRTPASGWLQRFVRWFAFYQTSAHESRNLRENLAKRANLWANRRAAALMDQARLLRGVQ